MIKDTYTKILAEIREIVKHLLGLKIRIRTVKERIGREGDKLEIEEIKKQIQG